MNYDVPKLPQKPQVVIERPFFRVAESDCATNESFRKQQSPFEPPDLGGYPFRVTISGTASGTSLSTVPSYQIDFMPRDGVIPSYEMQQQHLASALEWIINPTKKRG